MREFAESFYSSKAWHDCRKAYRLSVGGLCERCRSKGLIVPGEIVHHKVHLTPDNITNESVTLDWSNLELLCRNCHAEIHNNIKKRYFVDENGKIIASD